MKAKFLEGKNIYLSPLSKEDDVGDYTQWLNDQETTFWMYCGKFPSSAQALRKYIDDYNKCKDGILLGIFARKTAAHIGNITLHKIDSKNRCAEIGILIGDKKSRGKGYATQALKLVVEHAFYKLNLRRLFANIVENNKASIKIFEKTGFKKEGTLREHFYNGDKYYDCYFYGLLKDEYHHS